MKWWNEFLKKRRQSDRVKLMLLLFLIGIFFFGDLIYRGVLVYQTVESPVEYVLSGSSGRVTDAQIAQIRELDDVRTVSRQRESEVTLRYQEKEFTFSCVELSQSYLEIAYGAPAGGAMKIFYLNRAAYGQMRRMEEAEKEQGTDPEKYMNYVMSGEETQETNTGTARIAALEDTDFQESPQVFCQGNSADLSGDSAQVRVLVSRQDLEGTWVKKLTNLGFEVSNAAEIQQTEMLWKMQFLRMRYDGIIFALSLLCLGAFHMIRREHG